MNDPIEVEVTNRGEGAATGIGLVLGGVGVLVLLMLLATAVVAFVIVVIPALIIWLIARTLIQLVRIDARYAEWVDEMGVVDHNP